MVVKVTVDHNGWHPGLRLLGCNETPISSVSASCDKTAGWFWDAKDGMIPSGIRSGPRLRFEPGAERTRCVSTPDILMLTVRMATKRKETKIDFNSRDCKQEQTHRLRAQSKHVMLR